MKLSDLDHLRNIPFIRFTEEDLDGYKVTIVCYMLKDPELQYLPLAKECRGLTFYAGELISWPMEIFYNVNEIESTQLHKLREYTISSVTEKRDGSLIVPVKHPDGFYFKSKKTFFSDVALLANETVDDNVRNLCRFCIKYDMTPCFEFTSPENKVVIDYGSDRVFTLISIRNNKYGYHHDYSYIKHLAKIFGVNVVPQYDLTLDQLLEAMQTEEKEGYVVCFQKGEEFLRVKFKTDWYKRNHRLMTELRVRDVAEMIVDETIDDIKSELIEAGKDISVFEKLEHEVVKEYCNIVDTVYNIVTEAKAEKLSFKEAALKYKDNVYFGLIMSSLRNKEPDFKKFWKDNYLKGYSLVCLYNASF